MWLDVLKLFLLGFIIVMLFVILRYISTEINNSRKIRRIRDVALDESIERVEKVSAIALEHEKVVDALQQKLDTKLDELQETVNQLTSFIAAQQNQFIELAKSDMLTARREELIRAKELLISLERIVSISTMSRQDPAAIDVLAIESVKSRINELEKILS